MQKDQNQYLSQQAMKKLGNNITLSVLAGRRKLTSFTAILKKANILKESGIKFNVTRKGG